MGRTPEKATTGRETHFLAKPDKFQNRNMLVVSRIESHPARDEETLKEVG
jgi:hypothetical protein